MEALSRVVGVRSIAPMPLIRTIRPRMFARQPLPALPGRGDVTGDFPVVVVVDSGIASNIPGLESWVVGRDSQVAPEYSNTDHGTFVAGLICWGSQLNPTISGIDTARAASLTCRSSRTAIRQRATRCRCSSRSSSLRSRNP